MSRLNVEPVIRTFVKGESRPRGQSGKSFALRGSWGVGKTYLWNSIVEDVWKAGNTAHARERYVYVSLFGIGTLHELKAALAAAALVEWVPERQRGTKWSLRKHTAARLVPQVGSVGVKLLEGIPVVGGAVSALAGGIGSAIAFEMVRDALVCFDDLERSSNALPIKDFFGLVTQLREERGCDVCVILNDGQIEGADAREIEKHEEKAIDVRLHYDPTPEDAFALGFHGFGALGSIVSPDLIRSCCMKLEIRNLRVLQRIRRTLESLAPYLSDRSGIIAEDAVRAAILLVWGYHTPRGEATAVPPFELIRKPGSSLSFALLRKTDQKRSPEQQALLDLNAQYGYAVDDGVDQEIADYVEHGYFDRAAFTEKLDEEARTVGDRTRRDQLTKAWKLLHDSFDDNEIELVEALRHALHDHADVIDPNNFNSSLQLLRRLERNDLADVLAERYATVHKDNEGLLRFREHAFLSSELTDPKLIQALDAAASRLPELRTFEGVADKFAISNGWDAKDIRFLATLPTEDYERYCRYAVSRGYHLAIKRLLEFGEPAFSSSNDAPYRQVAEKAREALDRIGRTSRLNEMRLGRFGI
jgi:hypothetical protein